MPAQTTNLKKITQGIISRDYPHLEQYRDDILSILNKAFVVIALTCWNNGKVLIKNFATFSLKQRVPRKRYDSGIKDIVLTEPTTKIEFIQSNNVFDNPEFETASKNQYDV